MKNMGPVRKDSFNGKMSHASEIESAPIIQARIKKGLTQADLADLAGLHFQTITRLEAGFNVGVNTLARVVHILDVDPRDLFTGRFYND